MSELILDHEFIHDDGSYSLSCYPPYDWRELLTCIRCGIKKLGNKTSTPGCIGPVALFDGKVMCADRRAARADQKLQAMEWERLAPERERVQAERIRFAREALSAGTVTLTTRQLRQLYDLARDDDFSADLERDLATVLAP